MDIQEFRKHAHELVDWMADYLENIESYPVKSKVQPKEIYAQLPETPPADKEPFERIFTDFQNIILPGITHWQNPNFFAYFPANSSPPSILGEMLTSTLAAQCMIWQTSPAAAELEEKVMNWLKQMMGLPMNWSGVIQDTASTAAICSLLTAREKYSNFAINKSGFTHNKFRLYCSAETHSSVEKAVKICGFGSDALRIIDVDESFAMIPEKLDDAIQKDSDAGLIPLAVIGTIGTTSSTAVDPIRKIGEICRKYKVWYHVDGAFAGSALLLEDMRWMSDGLELADTYVFNPHKWLLTNFDCSAYFVKDEPALVRTFEILPEYLKTAEGDRVKNYRDWGIQLGRRFRALKLWFVIRSYGVNGLKEKIKHDMDLAQYLKTEIENNSEFEILAPVTVNMVCFRYKPQGITDEAMINSLNEKLLETINSDGKIYLTHTKLRGKYTIRLQAGQTYVQKTHVERAWRIILDTVKSLTR